MPKQLICEHSDAAVVVIDWLVNINYKTKEWNGTTGKILAYMILTNNNTLKEQECYACIWVEQFH